MKIGELYSIMEKILGVNPDNISTTTIIRQNNNQTVEIVHPALIDEKYPLLSNIILSIATSREQMIELLKVYSYFLKNVSPVFCNIDELSYKSILKAGLHFTLNTDLYGVVSSGEKFIITYNKTSGKTFYGYSIIFNPDSLKHYRTEVKQQIMNYIISPFIDMFFIMINIHSPSFTNNYNVYQIKNRIKTLIEASFNKKLYDGKIEVVRKTGTPIIIKMYKDFETYDIKVSIENIEKVKIKKTVQ